MTSVTANLKGKSKYTMLLGHLAALISVIAWGSSFISTKVLMVDGGFSPIETFFGRFLCAWFIIMCFTFRKIKANNWRDELAFLVSGICACSLYFILENYALLKTTTANVSLLSGISPIFTALLMAVIFGQRIKFGVATGSIVAFGGVACVIFSTGEGMEIHPVGDILALASALSWAMYSIVVKRLLPLYSSFFITRKLFFYGMVTAIPLMLLLHKGPFHFQMLLSLEHAQYLLNFLFLVVMCSVVAYIIWNEAMRILGPVKSANYLYMQPLVTMVMAYVIFHEEITLLGYVGCALIIGGLIFADKWDVRKLKQ